MNGVRVLTKKIAAWGDRVLHSFLSDRRLSKHIHTQVNFSLLSICNRHSMRLSMEAPGESTTKII